MSFLDGNKSPDDYTKRIQRLYLILAIISFLMIFVIPFLLFSSCTPKVQEVIHTQIEYRDRTIHDTVNFYIEKEVEKIITKDTVSELKNTYAQSYASYTNGFLTHTLQSIPQYIQVPVTVTVTDTINEGTIIKYETVEVERKLTWWERVRLDTYWILLAIIAIYVALKILLKKFSIFKK